MTQISKRSAPHRHHRSVTTAAALSPLLLALACSGGPQETESESTSIDPSATATQTTTASASASASASDSDTDTTTSTGGMSASDSSSSTATTTAGTTDGETTSVIPPNCGDGVLDPGEECDDGADFNVPGNACNPDCTLNVCGDGVQGPEEECDDGPNNGEEGECSAMCTINESACGVQAYEAMLEIKPVDIIITIDNSGSMSQEIKGVQDNINVNFASIIEASGLDYRVIMVTRHGAWSSRRICVEAPLSGIPEGGCSPPPAQPVNNPGKFYHYSAAISSHNAWCRVHDSFDGSFADEYGFAPDGWQEWLREDSIKTFIAISDDGSSCGPYNDGNNVNSGTSAAAAYDAALQQLSPLHFGDSPENRNYFFYSIVGMAYNNPPTDPYTPDDPIILSKCPGGVDAGTGHQALSVLTNSLRFPICDTTSYDVVFQAIADGVIKGAKITCEFPLPEPPDEETIDLESMLVEYTPMGIGDPQTFTQVDGPDQCGPDAFYIDVDAKMIHLCPESCSKVQADFDAKIDIQYSCEPFKPG